MGRVQKERKNTLKYQWPTCLKTFYPPSTFSHSHFRHVLREKQDISPCLFVCFPRAVDNRHAGTPRWRIMEGNRWLFLSVPSSWSCTDWQNTDILHMPFLYRVLTTITVVFESKLSYEQIGMKTPNRVPQLVHFFWTGSLIAKNQKLHRKNFRKWSDSPTCHNTE